MTEPLRDRWLDRLKRPWHMADAEKCMLVSVLVGAVTGTYTWFEYLYTVRPDMAPYIDQSFVRQLIPWHLALTLAWMGILLMSYLAQSRPRLGRWSVIALTQLYVIGFSLTSYCYGHFTTNYLPTVIFGGLTIGFLLFDKYIVLGALASSLLIVIGTTIAEQSGVIPSAPLLASSPIIDQRLSPSWLWSLVSLIVLTQVIATLIVYYFFDRLRVWERELEQARDLISQYVPRQVADAIRSGLEATVTRHERRKLTIFFSDVVGFSEIAEDMEPEELSLVVNEYFSVMTDIAHRYGGTIDELAGDAILVFFGAPQSSSDRDHALRAVRMAIDMQAAIERLNLKWRDAGIAVHFEVRTGINTGVVTIGNFGSKGRMKYAAIGRHVNIAARLQAHCAPGRILLSHATWLLVQKEIDCEPRGELQLKGIQRPVMAYEVQAALPAEPDSRPLPAVAAQMREGVEVI